MRGLRVSTQWGQTPLGTDKNMLWQGPQPVLLESLPHMVPCRALVFVAFQYDYMGADKDAVTAKIVQLFSYVNSVSCFWLHPERAREMCGSGMDKAS